MSKYIGLFLYLFLISCSGNSQNFEKVSFGQEDDDYYLVVEPQATQIKGAIILLPGFGQTAETIFPETRIHSLGYSQGFLVMAIAGGAKLYADETVIEKLNAGIKDLTQKYDIPEDTFIIGGFSAGGTISLRYAEYCYEKPEDVPIQPIGVFSVDSPVDLFDIWNYFDRELKKNYSEAGTNEARFVQQIMRDEIGDPVANKSNYDYLTPFDHNLTEPGNERYLNDIAVRVYHDVDIAWQIKNRRRSLYDMNALVASEFINRLMLTGNEKAEFMQSKEPGYRSAGFRHPHSWSIVDEDEMFRWVNSLIADE